MIKFVKIVVAGILCLSSTADFCFAQENEIDRYYFSKLYDKGQYEIHVFNNYYTQQEFAEKGFDFDRRANFFTMWGQFLYGLNKRVNIGFDVRFRSVNQNFRENSSMWEALRFQNDGLIKDNSGIISYSRTGLSNIGPRIKYLPFKDIPTISFLHTILFPLGSDLEGNDTQGFLDWNNITIINQLFFDHDLNNSMSLFVELGLVVENFGPVFFRQREGYYQVSTPMNIIFSYFWDQRSTVYLLVNASPRWGVAIDQNLQPEKRSAAYNQYGLGYKYFFSSNVQVEFLYSFFNSSIFGQKARTLNIGIRYYGR